jgi:hypothetical protein
MTNRTVRLVVCSAFGLVLAGSGSAFAQDNPPAAAEGAPPAAAGGEATPAVAATPAPAAPAAGNPTDITMHAGGVGISADIVTGLNSGAAGKPINIIPNVYYGVTDVLTVGLANNPGDEIFQSTVRPGLCLSGESNGCAKVYNNLSLDALFSFMRQSTMDLGAHGGLDFLQFSPDMLLSIRLGVKGKVAIAGPLQLVFDPNINIGATKRDAGNKEFLTVPVRLGANVIPQLNVGLSLALAGPIDHFGDFYTIPLGIGGTFAINNMLDVRAQFAFTNLAGKGSTADARTLAIGAVYHM